MLLISLPAGTPSGVPPPEPADQRTGLFFSIAVEFADITTGFHFLYLLKKMVSVHGFRVQG